MNSASSAPFSLLLTRVINLLQILSGYLLSRITRKVIHFGSPVAIAVEPTNACNLTCPECPSGQKILTRPKGFMDPLLFEKISSSLEPEISYLTLYFQGEPYLHPAFTNLISYAKSKNLVVATSTNGHFLTPENARETVLSGLDKLIISLDGTDEAAYLSYRKGGSFKKVIHGLEEIVRQKVILKSGKPRVIVQFLVLRTNENQIGKIKAMASALGADEVQIKSAQFYDYENGNPLMPLNKKYSRYLQISGSHEKKFSIKNNFPRHCFRMWSSCVITWDGWVVPCCFDKDAQYRMGNIREESFMDIWKGKKYNAFRKRILTERESIDMCRNCTEGMGFSKFF